MNIIVDSGLKEGRHDGIGTYFHNLTSTIQNGTSEIELNIQPDHKWFKCLSWLPLGLRKIPYLFWNNFILPQIISKQKTQLLHGVNMVVPLRQASDYRTILTIYDLSYLRYPEALTVYFRWYYNLLIPKMVSRADHIIAISEFTKSELMSLLNVPENKISVTHLAPKFQSSQIKNISQHKYEQDFKKLKIKKPYILAVGTIEPRKNLPRLIKAFSVVCKNMQTDLSLVIVGAKGWLTSDTFKEASNEVGNINFLGYVSNDILQILYQEALFFAYPSLYEGFGLPILEAMTLGTPVMTSNVSSMPEIAGDAAFLVDPLDVQSMVSGITQLVEDRELRMHLIELGKKRTLEFSWEFTATKTIEVYKKLV